MALHIAGRNESAAPDRARRVQSASSEITLSAEVGVGVVPGVLVILEDVQARGLGEIPPRRVKPRRRHPSEGREPPAGTFTLAYSIFSVQHPE